MFNRIYQYALRILVLALLACSTNILLAKKHSSKKQAQTTPKGNLEKFDPAQLSPEDRQLYDKLSPEEKAQFHELLHEFSLPPGGPEACCKRWTEPCWTEEVK